MSLTDPADRYAVPCFPPVPTVLAVPLVQPVPLVPAVPPVPTVLTVPLVPERRPALRGQRAPPRRTTPSDNTAG